MYGSISEKPSTPRGDGRNVLVVVDDPGTAELLTATLQMAGYQAGTAGTGTEASVRLAQHRFDLVVLDPTLPNLDGLLARMQAGGPRYRDLALDDVTCQARRGARPLDLTPAEYRLLRHLLVNPGCVLSKEQISRHVWGEFRAGNAIEKLVSRLRHKVDQEEPALIHTRRGFGYWLGHLQP